MELVGKDSLSQGHLTSGIFLESSLVPKINMSYCFLLKMDFLIMFYFKFLLCCK